MKYDISGLEKDKIIDHYKVVKRRNKHYNILIYYRNGVGKATNYPYENMIDLKKELDLQMLKQLRLLVENDDIAEKTFSDKGAKQANIFSKVGNTISLLGPIALSIIFDNPINLIFIPMLLGITDNYKEEYLFNVIDDEYENYMRYKMCIELEDEFSAIKEKQIDINKIDNYKIKELKKIKAMLIHRRESDNLSPLLNQQKEKQLSKKL